MSLNSSFTSKCPISPHSSTLFSLPTYSLFASSGILSRSHGEPNMNTDNKSSSQTLSSWCQHSTMDFQWTYYETRSCFPSLRFLWLCQVFFSVTFIKCTVYTFLFIRKNIYRIQIFLCLFLLDWDFSISNKNIVETLTLKLILVGITN